MSVSHVPLQKGMVCIFSANTDVILILLGLDPALQIHQQQPKGHRVRSQAN